jgi:curved DNA-binding protein CbpA
MTEFDPYLVLGVDRAAQPTAIKTAYRNQVRTAHPDRGGDTDTFIAIVRAFGVLSDPEARRLFDETGVIDDDNVKDYRTQVATILADMFDTAVQSAVDSGLMLTQVNFIALMANAVQAGANEASGQANRVDGEIRALSDLRSRIRRNDERSNIFVDRLNDQIKAKTEQHAAARRRVFLLETAIVELGNYESEVELIEALQTT